MYNVKDEIDKLNKKFDSLSDDLKKYNESYSKLIDLMDSVNCALSDHSNYDDISDRMHKLEGEIDKLKIDLDEYLEERKGDNG